MGLGSRSIKRTSEMSPKKSPLDLHKINHWWSEQNLFQQRNGIGAQEYVASGESKGRQLQPFFQRNLAIEGKREIKMQVEGETKMKKGFKTKISSSMIISNEERIIREEHTENTEDRGMAEESKITERDES